MAAAFRPLAYPAWLVIAALVLPITACSPSTSTVSPTPSDAVAVLHCEDVIASAAAPPSDASVILDGVALPTGRALQANGSGGSDPHAKLFAKDGLFIRRGAALDLIVPKELLGRLAVIWGSLGKPTTQLRVPGCRPSQRMPSSSRWDLSDDWLVYPGGYFVTQAACVSLLVRAGQKEQTVRIGVGASCPGQSPPPSLA
jgi:hypothetical protein